MPSFENFWCRHCMWFAFLPPLPSKILTTPIMGVEAQNDLRGTKVLPEKWLESCLTKQSFFLQKKKRSSLKLSRFFCPNCGDLQKKGLRFEPLFLSKLRWPPNILQGKLAQTTWNCPKFIRNIAQKNEIARNFDAKSPKYMKLPKILPEIWTPYTNRGGGASAPRPTPPPPPTPMVDILCWVNFLW